MGARTGSRRRSERGTATAEAALVLPTLVLFTVAMAWLVSLGVTQVRAVDAAREAARSVARGESTGHGSALARRVADPGSTVRVSDGEALVVVRVSSPVRGPGGVLGFLPRLDVRAEAVAAKEPLADVQGGAAP